MKQKKTIALVALLFIFTAASQAQTIQGLFDKYADDRRFQFVSVGKSMVNMASAFGGITKNDKEMMSKMKGIKILTLEANAESAIMKAVLRDLSQVIETGDFETAVEARNKNEQVHIYYRVTGKDNADMLIVTKEKKELSLIWLSGKMTKEEMMQTFSYNERGYGTHWNSDKIIDSIS